MDKDEGLRPECSRVPMYARARAPRPGWLLLCLLFPLLLTAQTDSLLRAVSWQEEGTEELLRLTADGTFELDYGPGLARGRYLMGRYTIDEDSDELTLSVDYFLGRKRIHPRYRQGQDFYLTYAVDSVSTEVLLLYDVLTRKTHRYRARPNDEREDPAERPLPKQQEWKLPELGTKGY